MKFATPPNTQFACITIDPLSLSKQLPESVDLGIGRFIFINPSFEIDQFWQQQLGELKVKAISENSVLLVALIKSDSSDGSMDRELIRSVRSLLYSFFLQGIYFSDGGSLFCGGDTSGRIVIRSNQDLDNFFRPRETITELFDAEVINRAASLAQGLEFLYVMEDQYRRLKRGFHSYSDAVRSLHEEGRIRHFVRSVEAILKPDIGKTRRQFVYRGQLLVGRSTELSELLGDLYDLRSWAEHMNDLQLLYPDLSHSEIDRRVALRSFQSELVANHAYRRICERRELREVFATDSRIQDFWAKPLQEQAELWGIPVDIRSKVKERFNQYFMPKSCNA